MTCLDRQKWKFQEIIVGCLGYVSIKVFESDSIWCSCEIVEWEGDTNHTSINTSDLFGIFMCCGYIIYGITVTRASTMIPREAIRHRIELFGVHLACFIGGLSIYWWGLRMIILVGTWWIWINRTVCVIT